MRRWMIQGWQRPCMRSVAWVSIYRLLNLLLFLILHAKLS